MSKIYIIATIFIAFFSGLSLSFTALVSFFWFWRLDWSSRMWLGLFSGFLMDIFSPFSFGSHLVLFFLLGGLVTILRLIFTDVKPWVTQGIGIIVLFFIFVTVMPRIDFMLSYLKT